MQIISDDTILRTGSRLAVHRPILPAVFAILLLASGTHYVWIGYATKVHLQLSG